MQAIIFCGIQATGKSTFYKERFFHSHVRISMDLLRTRHRERRLLELCIETQARFVVDNTNPTPDDRQRYIGPARQAGYRVVGYFFQSAVSGALARNRSRPLSEQIPERGIFGTRARLVPPAFAEGFDELYHVRIGPAGSFVVEPWRS